MKKIIGIIAVACMTVSLTACGTNSETTEQIKNEISAAPETVDSVDTAIVEDNSDSSDEENAITESSDTTPVDNTVGSEADSEDLNVIKADKGITDFDYEGTWACDRCTIDIVYKGEYDVLIDWGNSADESEQWSYSCFYDPQARTLICEAAGSHTKIITGEDGSTDVEKDGTDMSATFYIKDGKLIWLRSDEESSEPMVFERMEY